MTLTVLLFAGCGVVERGTLPPPGADRSPSPPVAVSEEEESSQPVEPETDMVTEESVDDAHESLWSSDIVVRQLRSAHSAWRGTPYVLGGSGINGVDCSSFTQIIFQDFFGAELPRNTRSQLQEGSGIRRNGIRPGDLIFFRTSRNVLHVGIAIEGGDFLHASVSEGVTISNLDDRYWASRYLGTRRVL